MLIIDQVAKAKEILKLLAPEVSMDDQTIYRLIVITDLEGFETACHRLHSYCRANKSLPKNIHKWMKDTLYIIRYDRQKQLMRGAKQ